MRVWIMENPALTVAAVSRTMANWVNRFSINALLCKMKPHKMPIKRTNDHEHVIGSLLLAGLVAYCGFH